MNAACSQHRRQTPACRLRALASSQNLYNPGAAALASSPRVCHQATASPQSEVPPVPPTSRVRTKCADSDALSFMSFAALSTLTKVLSTEFLMLSRLV